MAAAAEGSRSILRFELVDEYSEMLGHGSRKGVVLVLQVLPNCEEPNASIASGVELALALRGMRSVTVLNDMPTDPIVDAVGCLSRGGNCRHGAPPSELQGRLRDKPITANARTKTANARPLNPFASSKRMTARASHTSSPFPRRLRNAQTVSRVPDLCD